MVCWTGLIRLTDELGLDVDNQTLSFIAYREPGDAGRLEFIVIPRNQKRMTRPSLHCIKAEFVGILEMAGFGILSVCAPSESGTARRASACACVCRGEGTERQRDEEAERQRGGETERQRASSEPASQPASQTERRGDTAKERQPWRLWVAWDAGCDSAGSAGSAGMSACLSVLRTCVRSIRGWEGGREGGKEEERKRDRPCHAAVD